MAQRKYLIILLWPLIAGANPWIPEKGRWKYSFEISNYKKPQNYNTDLHQFMEIEKAVILLQKELLSIENKISNLSEKARNQENIRRLEIHRDNYIDEINKLKKNLKKLEEYLYLDYKISNLSNEFEYGLKNNISLLIGSNFTRAKYSNSRKVSFAIKYKIYEKKNKLFTLKTGLNIDNSYIAPNIAIIWGESKKFKILDSFFYNSFEISAGRFGNIYHHEAAIGSRFPRDIIILIQTFNRTDFMAPKIYQSLFRKQYKIAKEIRKENRSFALSFGYFNDTSLSAKKHLASGFSIGIWGEI